MAGIGIIANPHSKLNRQNPRRPQILSYIAGQHGDFQVTNSLEELDQVAQHFFRHSISILAINGGDGTISRTIGAMIRVYKEHPLPRIALLRGGTVNMLAKNLDIKGTPEQLLYRLIHGHSLGENLPSMSLTTLQIGTNYGFLFGNGVSARFLNVFYKKKTSSLGAVLTLLRLVVQRFLAPKAFSRTIFSDTMSLALDRRPPIIHRSCAIFCATVPHLPLGIRFFDKMPGRGDQFQCISVVCSGEDLPSRLPSLILGSDSERNRDKMSTCCSHAVVTGSHDSLYTLDGELYEPENRSITIGLGPAVEFIKL